MKQRGLGRLPAGAFSRGFATAAIAIAIAIALAGAPSAHAATLPAAANLHGDASTYGSLGDREATARDHLCTDPATICALGPRELLHRPCRPDLPDKPRGPKQSGSGGDLRYQAGKLQEGGAQVQAGVSIFAGGIDQLAALTPPAADSSLIASWIESLRVQVPILNKFAKALAKHKRLRVVNLAGQLQTASDHSQGIVSGYGFQVCNQF